MERKNKLLKYGFLIVVLLTLALAFMRVSNPGSGVMGGNRRPGGINSHSLYSAADRQALEALKQEEMLGVAPAGGEISSGGQPGHTASARYARAAAGHGYAVNTAASGPYARQHEAGRSADAGRYAASSQAGRFSSYGHSYTPEGGASSYQRAANTPGAQPYASGRRTPASAAGARGGKTSGFGGAYRPSAQERSQGIFAPYLTSLTKEQSESLNKQLTGLSSRVERAVLQALMPKSRKDANIEKYLQRNSSYSANSGPFGSVMEQMAVQKAGIMNSMNGAFGKEAADAAGKLMDAYQQELAAALSQPGQTQEQLAQKTRSIGQKYEKELQNLGQDYAMKEFKDKQEQKDNFFHTQFAQAYGDDIAAQAEQIMASYRDKDLQLAMAGLPEAEYYKQSFENQAVRRKELEDLLVRNGKSLQLLRELEDKKERDRVQDMLKDVEDGKTLLKEHHYSQDAINQTVAQVEKEQKNQMQQAQLIYGEEGAAAIQAIYNQHNARMNEIMQSDMPEVLKEQAIMDLRQKETNAQIEALQKTPQMREKRENWQVNSAMEQLMQDPGIAKASPEEQAKFEQKARPILQEMYHQINDVLDSDLPDKEARIEALRVRAQQQLSGQ